MLDRFDEGLETHWRAAAHAAREENRELIDAVVRWARTRERLLDPDVVAVLIAAANEDRDQGPATFWTKTRVSHMFCDHLDNWGYDNRVDWGEDDDTDVPDGDMREALWLLLTYLVESGALHPDSHPPTVLFAQLHGVDEEGFATRNPRYWEQHDPDGDWYGGPTYGELQCRNGR